MMDRRSFFSAIAAAVAECGLNTAGAEEIRRVQRAVTRPATLSTPLTAARDAVTLRLIELDGTVREVQIMPAMRLVPLARPEIRDDDENQTQ